MEKVTILPDAVCCDRITVEHGDGVIGDVVFENGCDGNGKALARLLRGMRVDRAVELLSGVDCEGRGTSCADQMARGLVREILDAGKHEE